MNALLILQVRRRLRQLRRHDLWTRQQLEKYQLDSLRRLRRYAYDHSPFYRRFHQGLTDRPLQDLPVLTKKLLMDHFDELVTDRSLRLKDVEQHLTRLTGDQFMRGRYRATSTSGTTGQRGLFLFNRSEWVTVLASFARSYQWAGLDLIPTHRLRVAAVTSNVSWHISARVTEALRSGFLPLLRLDATEPLADIVRELNEWQPALLGAYPSALRLLATEQLAGRLHISPCLIWTSAEVLTDETRRLSEAAWGTRPFDQYATTEGAELAAECAEHRGLHLCEDMAIVEIVDRDNRPVPRGMFGDKVLITVFASRTQPLIRYELSDRLRLAAIACPCGRPYTLVDAIEGREEDTLYFLTPEGDTKPVHPNVFHRLLDTVPSAGWQVVQEPDRLILLLAGTVDDVALVESVRRELASQGILIPVITVEHVPSIPQGATGKTPLVKSNLTKTGNG